MTDTEIIHEDTANAIVVSLVGGAIGGAAGGIGIHEILNREVWNEWVFFLLGIAIIAASAWLAYRLLPGARLVATMLEEEEFRQEQS